MAKSLKTIKLTGYDNAFNKARIGMDVKSFNMPSEAPDQIWAIRVHFTPLGEARVVTAKGSYLLKKHPTANRYEGIANGVKVHFCPKKITAQLLYWA